MLRTALFVLCLTLQLTGCEAVMLGNLIISCTMRPEPTLLPEYLPVAKVGVPYSAPLEVTETSSPVHGIYVSDKHPLPDGLRIEHHERDSYGLITGIPASAGSYQVQISAGTYGTQCTGLEASRIYRLEVME